MFKLGIYSLDQLKRGRYRSILGGVKKISASLLTQIDGLPDSEVLRERILLELTDDSGAYKRTYGNRFKDFDRRVVDLVKARFLDKVDVLRFHDSGVSSGQTAVDFFNQIVAVFPRIHYFASDYDPHIVIAKHGNITAIFSSVNDELIEVTLPPFVLPTKQTEKAVFYPVNHLVRWFLIKAFVPRIRNLCRSGELGVEKVSLFSPDALALAEKDKRFTLGQYNLLDGRGDTGKYHCFRAMNVLNTTYFNDRQINVILNGVFDALSPGGIFILGSNQESDTTVDGGVYEKHDSGFELLWSSGSGAAISRLIDNFRWDSTHTRDQSE